MMLTSLVLALAATASALSSPAARAAPSASGAPALGRGAFLSGASAAALALARPALAVEKTPSGMQYEVIKRNEKGIQAKVGDLIAVRFKGTLLDGKIFDDITETPEPLYYRVGGGNLIKGIDEAIQNMHYGETWKVLIPPELAFGEKGRSPSAGKPRIPGSTSLYYEISFVGFPGFEGDLFLQQNQ